ncbi:MAG: protein kinase [Acidobacteriota bacterium]|jgi:serine/threonine protein kinase/tetratricopeptide (TPR) repeat protein
MKTVGMYELLEKLSDGTLGAVYKAYDSSRDRHVVIHMLGAEINHDPAPQERYSAEWRAIFSLKHPNIAAVYELGQDGQINYLATEWLPAKDLKGLIAERSSMKLEQKLAAMILIGAGLGHAHAQGVLHRNIWPCNILILPDGTAKVADFGIGLILSSLKTPLPAPHVYRAPEQLQGKEATRQSDIFSLGVVFYEFLTGTHPFHDDDSSKVVDNILHQIHFPTVEQFPELPFSLWPILERCLAKDAEERLASMSEFGAACQGVLEELAEDSQWMRIELQTALPRLKKAARRQAAPLTLGRLLSEVELALLGGNKSDYQLLNRLVLALAEQHHLVESLAEAPSTSPPDSTDFRPEIDPPAARGDTALAEPSAGAPGLMGIGPASASVIGSTMENAAAEPLAKTDSDIEPRPLADRGDDKLENRIPDLPAAATPESPSLSTLPEALRTALPATPTAARRASGGPLPVTAGRKDQIPELLRKIHQGQDSTWKTVDNMLAGRQARGTATQSPTEGIRAEQASAGAKQELTAPKREATPAPAQAGTNHDPQQQHVRQYGPNGEHATTAAAHIGKTRSVSAAPPKRHPWRTTGWICASALLLTLALAVPSWVHNRPRTRAGNRTSAPKPQAKRTATLPTAAGATDPVTSAIRDRLSLARRDTLLEEGQILHSIGRFDESRVFLNRLLELYPSYQPAQQELDQIKAETNTPQDQNSQLQPVQKLLASASSAFRAGNMQKAKIDLDKVEQLQPGLAEAANLRKRLEAKKSELAVSTAREQEAQQAAQRQKAGEALTRRTEELYRQGKYDEALTVVQEHLGQYPQLPQALELQSRTVEVQRSLKTYETAIDAGKFPEARAALETIERINPADPNLPTLRRRAETAPVSGSASLSMYPTGETADLMLDGQPVGANGELINQPVPAGRHQLQARNSKGIEVALTHEFSNGQTVSMVYDVSGQVLRPMMEADRELMSRNKAKQQMHSFPVEHNHGVFRGSCKGNLLVDYYHVVYQPETGTHGFSVPFKNLKVRIEDKTAVLLFAADSKEFFVFRFPDVRSVQALKKLWDDLAAIDK